MIIIRLTYLAVCLLVLLKVVSTMGGNNDNYHYYNSKENNSVCLSFKNNRLTDCCKQDDMQRIYNHKTSPWTGFLHIKDYKKVLCYDKKKMKFKLYRRKSLGLASCRHQRKKERQHRLRGESKPYPGCSLSPTEIKKLKRKGCELYEHAPGAGYIYISHEESALYLGLRKGRVQKHKRVGRHRIREPRFGGRGFVLMSETDIRRIPSCA